MAPAIPDRWTAYKACGKVVEGTKFICFKVPLRRLVQIKNKEIDEIWDVSELLSRIPKLGAVIDLTNTNRYYNYKDIESAGVRYTKILMPGRIIPPHETVKKFMDTVDEHLKKLGTNALIGVHCTHGLNRTGYMVCRYMKERMGIPGKDAIKSNYSAEEFEKARGYQIERDNYIADILGKTPPPPEFGEETTVVVPVGDKNTNRKQILSDSKLNDVHKKSSNDSKSKKPKRKRYSSNSTNSSFEFDYGRDY